MRRGQPAYTTEQPNPTQPFHQPPTHTPAHPWPRRAGDGVPGAQTTPTTKKIHHPYVHPVTPCLPAPGVLVMESLEHALARGAPIIAEYLGGEPKPSPFWCISRGMFDSQCVVGVGWAGAHHR